MKWVTGNSFWLVYLIFQMSDILPFRPIAGFLPLVVLQIARYCFVTCVRQRCVDISFYYCGY